MILALTESHFPLGVRGLSAVLKARFEAEKVDIYKSEMVYMLVKHYYNGVTAPSEFADSVLKLKRIEKSGEKIIDSMINRLKGGG